MLLALDTASQLISLALHDGRQIDFEATWHTTNNHTVELTPAIQRALATAEMTIHDLEAIAIAKGPGSFTGLRIGMGVAKGMALALSIPLVAVPSLDIVAAGVPVFEGPLVAVLPAGRGRACAQTYNWQHDGWIPQGDAAIVTWQKLIDAVERETLFAGEIDERGQAMLDESERPIRIAPGAHALRRAGFLAELAWARVEAGEIDDPATVAPIYLHRPGLPHP